MERNMDESRKQFEEWFAKEYEEVNNSTELSARVIKMIALSSWLASTTAIEIELPESFTMHGGRTHYLYVSEVQSAIRAAGIKVKE